MDTSKGLRLTIELVPRPCWQINARTCMTRENWDTLRRSTYTTYNYHCGVCQVSNVQMQCHEIWQYDDEKHIQKLAGFIALCPMCHHCKHIGHAHILASEGKLDLEQVIEHFMRVNHRSREDYQSHKKAAFDLWRERNRSAWTTDLGIYAHLVTQRAGTERKRVG